MKVAFCLHGIVGGALGKGGLGPSDKILRLGHNYAKTRIFDNNPSVDVFVHTWSVDMADEIRRLYQPVKMHAQKQLYFDHSRLLKSHADREPERVNNHYSKWYSTQQVLRLRQQYERETGTHYDCVMLSRFDIAWQQDVVFTDHDMRYLHLPHLCMYKHKKTKNRIGHPMDYWKNKDAINLNNYEHYHVGWPHRQGSWGFWDNWFFSRPSVMDEFTKVFDEMNGYIASNPKLQRRISNHLITELHLGKHKLLNKVRFFMHFLTDSPLIRGWHAQEIQE